MKKLFAAALFLLTVGAGSALAQEQTPNFSDKLADKILYGKPKSWFAKHFFIGAKFGIFNDWTQGGATNFSYVIRPSFGYYINDRWAVGLKLNLIDSRLKKGESETVTIFDNINYTIAGLLMGKGLKNNFLSWEVKEFVRYRATKLFWERLNLWIELNAYQGMRYDRLDDGKLDTVNNKFIYGVSLYPAITLNVTEKWMLYTSFELFSLSYDGARSTRWFTTKPTDEKLNQGTFSVQFNPLYAIAKAVVNIGIIKSF